MITRKKYLALDKDQCAELESAVQKELAFLLYKGNSIHVSKKIVEKTMHVSSSVSALIYSKSDLLKKYVQTFRLQTHRKPK